jgi:hypothetical protein
VAPAKAEDSPVVEQPEPLRAPPPKLAQPAPEPPSPTPHYSPPDALLGEMGLVVAGEDSPPDVLRPGVSVPHVPEAPNEKVARKDETEVPKDKTQEGEKERGEDTEVDPVALAREFSQLFDEPERNS